MEGPSRYTIGGEPVDRVLKSLKLDIDAADLTTLSKRTATHYRTLTEGGVPPKVARRLTEEYQSHLLSIAVGPQVFPPIGE